jgi:hypothetical protein
MDVYLGTNCVQDTNGIVRAYGRDILSVETGKDGQLLLSAEVIQPDGSTVAKLRRNAWVMASDDFRVVTNPNDLLLIRVADNKTVLRARVEGPNQIAIDEALLFTGKGKQIFAVHDGSAIVGESGGDAHFILTQNLMSGFGRAIEISDQGIGIGAS